MHFVVPLLTEIKLINEVWVRSDTKYEFTTHFYFCLKAYAFIHIEFLSWCQAKKQHFESVLIRVCEQSKEQYKTKVITLFMFPVLRQKELDRWQDTYIIKISDVRIFGGLLSFHLLEWTLWLPKTTIYRRLLLIIWICII